MKIHSGTVAVITGAGSGIGRALALQLAQKGCHLALADINSETLTATSQLLQAQSLPHTTHIVDVADNAAVQQFATTILQEYGKAELLINNAGVALGGTIEQVSVEHIEWLFNINFWGTVHGVKAFLPILQQQPSAHIVNLSSVFGLLGIPGQAAYCASKFAVRGFSETLRQELADTPIHVSCVHPGGIKTNIARNARYDTMTKADAEQGLQAFERLLTISPDHAAKRIIHGIEDNKPRILIGREAYIMDLLQRIAPVQYARVVRFFTKRIQ